MTLLNSFYTVFKFILTKNILFLIQNSNYELLKVIKKL